jgi:hypothetical protein
LTRSIKYEAPCYEIIFQFLAISLALGPNSVVIRKEFYATESHFSGEKATFGFRVHRGTTVYSRKK